VPPQYVPQLQLEMLASGLRSALFVSRSAENGTNVFRVPRDDAYCACMLQLISRFYVDFVLTKRVPPKNFFGGWAVWRCFCTKTGELSAASKLLCHVAAEDSPFGQDEPLFL
jgi:hypothetical protein